MELIKIPSFPAKIETIFENEKRIAMNPKKNHVGTRTNKTYLFLSFISLSDE